jgi:hypothetical protein
MGTCAPFAAIQRRGVAALAMLATAGVIEVTSAFAQTQGNERGR